jgi:Spx/MgsR family transcriptional regulator
MSVAVYGIPNCDTVKKARAWLDARGVGYVFHDYKKEGADPARLGAWVAAAGRDALVNRRGTTWKKLDPAAQAGVDSDGGAVALMAANPSAIKRPVVEYAGGVLVGFDAAAWERALL